jgi:hypothetical protein
MYVVFGEVIDYDNTRWWLVHGFLEKDDAERLRLEYQSAHERIYREWNGLFQNFMAETDALRKLKYSKRGPIEREIDDRYKLLFNDIKVKHPDKQWVPDECLAYGIIELELTL